MPAKQWDVLKKQSDALVGVYGDAYLAVVERLKYQLSKGLSTHHSEALIREIRAIVEELDQYTYEWLKANVPIAYAAGSNLAIDKLVKYGLPNINATFGGIHTEAVKTIVADAFESVAGATKMMSQTLINSFRDSSKGIFQKGIVTGDTRKQLSKSLMHDLNNKGYTMYVDQRGRYIKLKDYINYIVDDSWVGFTDKVGRRWDLRNYSEMLTRTKITEAVSRGTENRLFSNGLDLVMISVSPACDDWCLFYKEKVFSISGRDKEYPPLSDLPSGGTPFHPRCRCRETPFVEKFEEAETIKKAKDIDKKYLGLNNVDGYADHAKLIELERSAGIGRNNFTSSTSIDKGLYPDEIAGVKRGKAMNRTTANEGRPNPNFTKSVGYMTNCQSCVVTYEARLRGYDVMTLPNLPNSMAKQLSTNTNMAWIDPQTGTYPKYIIDNAVTTPKKALKFLQDNVKSGERYTFEFAWMGRGNSGHIVSVFRHEEELRLYDPQSGKTITGTNLENYLELLKYKRSVAGLQFNTPPQLLRVDDKHFNLATVNKIMEGVK